MRTATCALLIFATAPALASDGIVPTSDPGSDCVAATLHADWTPRNRRYDEAYCAVNEARDAYERCLQNVSMHKDKAIPFFTDRCNAEDEGAYVSFNGQTHQVWRQPGKSHLHVRYAGTYMGDGVVVRIVPRRLIERHVDPSDPLDMTVRYAVDVEIRYGGETARIAAVYGDQR
jgi:hypothetical protein